MLGKKNLQDLQKTYLRRLSRRNENRSGIVGGRVEGGHGIRVEGKDEGCLPATTFILLFVGWWMVFFRSFCPYPWLFWLVFCCYPLVGITTTLQQQSMRSRDLQIHCVMACELLLRVKGRKFLQA